MKLEGVFHLLTRPRRLTAESLPCDVRRRAVDYARTHRIQRARYGQESWQAKNSYTVLFFYLGGVADGLDMDFNRIRTAVIALEMAEMRVMGRCEHRTSSV